MDLLCLSARNEAELPALAVERDRLTAPLWGKGLTEDQYVERERRLWRHPFARAGMRTWFLREPKGRTLASCESYRVEVLLPGLRAGETSTTGAGHGIASVFVEEALRGAGLAGHLLQLVNNRLQKDGALCTYLMSEIGTGLYARLGYGARPLGCRRFSAGAPEEYPAGAVALQPGDVPALLTERYRRPSAPLVLRASPEQVDWHTERSRFYAEVLGRQPPGSVGVRAGEAFGLWMHDYRADLLRVLMLWPGARLFAEGTIADPRSPEARNLRDVLHAARAEAGRYGLSFVEVWENALNPGWLRGGAPAAAGDVPMLMPLSSGVRAEDWLDWERCHWL